MPFFAQEQFPIPNKDLLSWTFDDLSYDMDEPVSSPNATLANETNAIPDLH